MKITLVTVAFFLLSMAAIWHTVQQLRRDQVGIRYAVMWISMWLVIGVTSLFPDLLNILAQAAGMHRIFFIIIITLFLLIALIFNLMSRINTLEVRQARLVRALSLLQHRIDVQDANTHDTK
ncbi:MAG TPA: DUF2304 domain-containing protein [Desulfonatronum sp.]|nr:DUF2304 domain-containing protein [Desulfonatronum sp.]